MSIRTAFVPVLCALLSAAAASAQNTHTIRRLTAPGLAHGTAFGVDAKRTIVGELLDGLGNPQPVRWVDGVGAALPLQPGGWQGSARAIGDSGHVAGKSANGASPDSATMWAPDGAGGFTTFDLGIAPGDVFSVANAVDQHGFAAGHSDNGLFLQPVVWPDDASVGAPVVLPTLPGMPQGEGYSLSANMVVTGYVANAFNSLAASWSEAGGVWTLTTLATLGGASAWAVGEDGSGLVYGSDWSPVSGRYHVVHWSGTAITDLGTIPGMDCFANAVNAGGEAVGRARTNGTPPFVGFLHRPGVGAVDLNSLLPASTPWLVTAAYDIADDGVIVGDGVRNGFLEPFVMIPVSVAHGQPTPGVTGVANSLTASGVTPNATAFFFVALAGGETVVPGCLEALDLDSPLQLGAATANAAGVATLSLFVPGTVAQIPLLFQAYDPAACHTSNVVPFTFP